MDTYQLVTDSAKKVRILSVDDEELNQIFIKEVLPKQYTIMPAMDGEEALAVIDQFKPDIVLLDVLLPGINGYAVCRAIRNNPNHGQIKIIFTSAKTRPKEREEGYVAGGNDYITKPFSCNELIGKVNIFSQMQFVEHEKQSYAHENNILRAHVQLLELMNYARRHYASRDDMRAFFKAFLRIFMRVTFAEAGLFLTCDQTLGVQYAVLVQEGAVSELAPRKVSMKSGLLVETLKSYKSLNCNDLNLDLAAWGLPGGPDKVRTLLAMSFRVSDQTRGGLFLMNKRGEQLFAADETALLESLIVEVEHIFNDRGRA